MNEKISEVINKQVIKLGNISIIIDYQGMGNEGMQFLCSQ
jgi:hypothetical protein